VGGPDQLLVEERVPQGPRLYDRRVDDALLDENREVGHAPLRQGFFKVEAPDESRREVLLEKRDQLLPGEIPQLPGGDEFRRCDFVLHQDKSENAVEDIEQQDDEREDRDRRRQVEEHVPHATVSAATIDVGDDLLMAVGDVFRLD
jgi:hypothetical protein